MAGTTRLELATSAVTGQRSNQLNYVPNRVRHNLQKSLRSKALPSLHGEHDVHVMPELAAVPAKAAHKHQQKLGSRARSILASNALSSKCYAGKERCGMASGNDNLDQQNRQSAPSKSVTGQDPSERFHVQGGTRGWWALSDLNGRPFGCKPNALTAELSALTIHRTQSAYQRQRSNRAAFS
jgi:hypothetical protein